MGLPGLYETILETSGPELAHALRVSRSLQRMAWTAVHCSHNTKACSPQSMPDAARHSLAAERHHQHIDSLLWPC